MPRRRNTELLKAVGKRIRALREDRDLTQAQLAEAADLTVEFVGRVEGGKASLSLANLAAVAAVFGVALPQILDTASPPPPPAVPPDEDALVRAYRSLDPRARALLTGMARLLVESRP